MKSLKPFLLVLILSMILGVLSPAQALAPTSGPVDRMQQEGELPVGLDQEPAATDSPDVNPILQCTGTGTGGDRADLRGIRFTVNQSFTRLVVRMDASAAGSYIVKAELRRSTGFVAAPETTRLFTLNVPGSPSATPYLPVGFSFGNVAVSGNETFTLKFIPISGPGTLYFETFGIGNKPCAGVEETDENNVANPTERGDPAGFKVLPAVSPLSLSSTYVATPPTIDGGIGYGEWNIANRHNFQNGFITLQNDGLRLYVLVDLLADTVDDALRSQDYFWLAFDTNQDVSITSMVDLLYGLETTTGNMRYSYFTGPGTLTGLQPNTFSSKGRGFGCYFADGSFSIVGFPFKFTCSKHLVWEFGIDLTEIMALPGGTARMGLRASSPNPAFTEDVPGYFLNNFDQMIEIALASLPGVAPVPNPAASLTLENDAIELTQAIQTRQNTLPLVQDKRTVARVYADVNGVASAQPAKVYLYGSRGGVDLPGSPLAMFHTAPTTINRATTNHTANFFLPKTWDEGSVSFFSRVTDMFGRQASSPAFTRSFTNKEVPVYWIVPINTGSNASPVLVSNAEITSQEGYLEAIYPVKDVQFVRKLWQDIGPTTVGNTIAALNQYYNNAVLAWILTVIFTGKSPYDLPDQIYGFTPSGGGISDPTWLGANGRVARGYRGTSLEGTMAHEINHNLDRSSGGTWGRHVPGGCGATGPDPSWPYSNDDIQEVGFDPRAAGAAVPSNYPDVMSYCQSGASPTKWISPYRWQNLFDTFTTPTTARMMARAADIQTVYYLSGYVDVDGTGALDPILIQPGLTSDDDSLGEYSVQVLNADDKPIASQFFQPVFGPIEPDEDITRIYFSFQLPAVQGADQVVLLAGDKVLDEIQVSDHAPTVTVLEPNGGETWSGIQTIRWSASDEDGDVLSFNILYSPDDGNTWYPVAAGVTGDSLEVDTSALPGGSLARVKVIASDGFNTAEDVSDGTFTLEEKPPAVIIHLPEADALAAPEALVFLQGEATDLEDANLLDENFIWTIGEDVLGIGREVNATLPRGWNDITLTVLDSQGNAGEAQVRVFVGQRIFMPYLSR